MVESRYGFRSWLHDGMEEYVHYVPVKADQSDLLDKIRWCRQHDAVAKIIAENARLYGQTVLTVEYMTGYISHVLNSVVG